jgi:hypothetical protein
METIEFERMLIRFTPSELIHYMMNNSFLHRELKCIHCNVYMDLKSYSKVKEKIISRCENPSCFCYRNRVSIRHDSFFSYLTVDFLFFSNYYYVRKTSKKIKSCKTFRYKSTTLVKLKRKIIGKIGNVSFESDKLGGPGKIINIDETILN